MTHLERIQFSCQMNRILRITVLSFILCDIGTVDMSVPFTIRQVWREHGSRRAPGWSNAHARLRTGQWARSISAPSKFGGSVARPGPRTALWRRSTSHAQRLHEQCVSSTRQRKVAQTPHFQKLSSLGDFKMRLLLVRVQVEQPDTAPSSQSGDKPAQIPEDVTITSGSAERMCRSSLVLEAMGKRVRS